MTIHNQPVILEFRRCERPIDITREIIELAQIDPRLAVAHNLAEPTGESVVFAADDEIAGGVDNIRIDWHLALSDDAPENARRHHERIPASVDRSRDREESVGERSHPEVVAERGEDDGLDMRRLQAELGLHRVDGRHEGVGEVAGPKRVLEASVVGAGIDKIARTELRDVRSRWNSLESMIGQQSPGIDIGPCKWSCGECDRIRFFCRCNRRGRREIQKATLKEREPNEYPILVRSWEAFA
jgi:hypothetical protein